MTRASMNGRSRQARAGRIKQEPVYAFPKPSPDPVARAMKKQRDRQQCDTAIAKAQAEQKASAARAERQAVVAARRRAWASSTHAPEYRARWQAESAAAREEEAARRRERQLLESKGLTRDPSTYIRVVSGGLPGSARRK
jgi:hypothetical protein